MKHNPISFISTLLQKVGLKQRRVGKAEKGVYQIDCNRVSLVNALLIKRAGGQVSGHVIASANKKSAKASSKFNLDYIINKVKQFGFKGILKTPSVLA